MMRTELRQWRKALSVQAYGFPNQDLYLYTATDGSGPFTRQVHWVVSGADKLRSDKVVRRHLIRALYCLRSGERELNGRGWLHDQSRNSRR